ncbi:MAG: FAD-binding protein [Candidatus Lokiarchaeota archaeon]|nr:FAD-binding protein [Candidatus Lokiarchaeota archaeon]MBD3202423.1 FAD-binding protein [Candidatus Lokiarchaeota archaeon]
MNMEYKAPTEEIKEKFKEIVGEDHYFDQKEIRWTYAFGGTIFQKEWIPDLILTPINDEQISKILKIANDEMIPVTTRGSGTSLSGGPMTPFGGLVLDLSRMDNILKLDIENNIVEVEPGVICDDLNEKLKEYSYFFPPDPGSSSVATIGGMIATNAGGIQAFKYGVTKQYVMYLDVVLSNGEKLTLGTNVLKSVSSYNIKDLFIGSEGTLGVITKVGLRIRPLPQERKLGLFIFDKVENIQNAVQEIRRKGIIPNLLEFMDIVILKAVRDYLGGEFHDFPNGYVLLAEMDGDSDLQVENDFSELFDIIIVHNPIFHRIAMNEKQRERLIRARKANLPALSRIKPTTCVEDCTILLSDFSNVIKKIERIPENINYPNLMVAIICHMEGNLHPTFLFNENNPNDVKAFDEAIDYLYEEIILPVGGSITGEHGIGKIKTPYMKKAHGEKVVELMDQIKHLFDPKMILNPGIGKGDTRKITSESTKRGLKNQKEQILELACMRCGFCVASCPSRMIYKVEAYSPRGRLSILNGLVHGELEPNQLVNDLLHTCTLCGICLEICPSGVKTYEIFEKAREILHKI